MNRMVPGLHRLATAVMRRLVRAFWDEMPSEYCYNRQLKPTQMLAVLRNEPVETRLVHPGLAPEFCVRDPGVGG